MNKYFKLLEKIVNKGENQINKKGNIKFLFNEVISLNKNELDQLFTEYKVAKTKLKSELELYLIGEDRVSEYNKVGVNWWNYIGDTFINSYPQYFKNLPKLINKINKEKRSSKNYMLFIGSELETNQLPCLSLIQFQIINNELNMTIYQRSADSNLGLPSDIYQMTLIADMIDIPLKNITFFIGNAHIYENNIEATKKLLNKEEFKFSLNV